MIATTLAAGSRLLCGASVRWHCDPTETTQRIYYGNHSSHLDFVMIWSALPPRLRRSARPVAGRDYWERGGLRRYLADSVFRAVLIERGSASATGSGGSAASARAAIEYMAREMGDQYSLIVFPEGTRSLDGEVAPFKSGLYHLSQLRPDVQLVPVYLENLNRILPKGESLPVPMMSRVIFGPAIPSNGGEDKADFLLRARNALIQLKDAP
jgi:1-acyl-sn-glycerol-3-phosphate acyltransferase